MLAANGTHTRRGYIRRQHSAITNVIPTYTFTAMFYIAAAILFLALSHTASAHGCWISDVAAVPVPTADINSVSERFCVPSPLANNTSMYQIGGALIQVDIFSHGGKTGDCGMAVEYILSQSGVRGGWWNEGELQYKISRL